MTVTSRQGPGESCHRPPSGRVTRGPPVASPRLGLLIQKVREASPRRGRCEGDRKAGHGRFLEGPASRLTRCPPSAPGVNQKVAHVLVRVTRHRASALGAQGPRLHPGVPERGRPRAHADGVRERDRDSPGFRGEPRPSSVSLRPFPSNGPKRDPESGTKPGLAVARGRSANPGTRQGRGGLTQRRGPASPARGRPPGRAGRAAGEAATWTGRVAHARGARHLRPSLTIKPGSGGSPQAQPETRGPPPPGLPGGGGTAPRGAWRRRRRPRLSWGRQRRGFLWCVCHVRPRVPPR